MKKNTTGFTSIELVIIIAVVCVLAGVGWIVYSMGERSTTNDTSAQDPNNTSQNLTKTNSDKIDEVTTNLAPIPTKSGDTVVIATAERQSIDAAAKDNCVSGGNGLVWGGWGDLPAEAGDNPKMSADTLFVKGSTSCGAPGANATGYELIMKKIEGEWKVISRAQQPPSASFCKEYGAPISWCEGL